MSYNCMWTLVSWHQISWLKSKGVTPQINAGRKNCNFRPVARGYCVKPVYFSFYIVGQNLTFLAQWFSSSRIIFWQIGSRSVGTNVDTDVSMRTHVSPAVSSCSAALRHICSIRRSVSTVRLMRNAYAWRGICYGPVSVCPSVASWCSIETVDWIELVFGLEATFGLYDVALQRNSSIS